MSESVSMSRCVPTSNFAVLLFSPSDRLIVHFFRTSAKATLVARQRKLEQRGHVLAQALDLHREETERLNLLGRRAENALAPIGRLPTEVLMIVFRLLGIVCNFPCTADSQRKGHPIWLASVCYRWSRIVLEPVGASLWTDLVVSSMEGKSSLPAVRSLRAALPRSRPLPLRIELRSDESPTAEPSIDVEVIVHLLIPELHRTQSLRVENVPIFASLFPLTGNFEKLERLHLDFLYEFESDYPTLPALFHHAKFPSFRSLELFRPGPIPEEQIQQAFGSPSFSGAPTRLVLHDFYFSLTSFTQLLRQLPNLTSLEFQDGENSLDDDISQLISDPTGIVQLAALNSLRLEDVASSNLLPLLNYPLLNTLSISLGTPTEDRRFVLVAADHPHLQSVTFDGLRADDVDIASIAASRGSVRRIVYRSSLEEVRDVSSQLFTYAHDVSSRASVPNVQVSPTSTTPLEIWLYPFEMVSEEDGYSDLLLNLEALWTAQQLRERVYGSNFRIHLPPHVAAYSLAFAELVSRFPDFLVAHPYESLFAPVSHLQHTSPSTVACTGVRDAHELIDNVYMDFIGDGRSLQFELDRLSTERVHRERREGEDGYLEAVVQYDLVTPR